MHVQEFGKSYAERLGQVATSGKLIKVSYCRCDYVTVVPTSWLMEAGQAFPGE